MELDEQYLNEEKYVLITSPEEAERRSREYHEIYGGKYEPTLRELIGMLRHGLVEAYLGPDSRVYYKISDKGLKVLERVIVWERD